MIEQGIPRSARAGFLSGVHKASHTYRMALYGPGAALSKDVREYTPKGEVVGKGYTAGGRKIDDWRVVEAGEGAAIAFDAVVWPDATIKAAGAVVYNDSVPGKPVVAVLTFGKDVISTDAPFIVRLEGRLLTI